MTIAPLSVTPLSVTPLSVTPLSVTPSAAAQAYRGIDLGASGADAASGGADFSATLQRAISGAIDAGTHADSQATQAIMGHGNLTEVVTAVSKAELALQTTVALRDRMVQAYQDIMKMPI
jgi:flagellar hook-basal body complex protein FliE